MYQFYVGALVGEIKFEKSNLTIPNPKAKSKLSIWHYLTVYICILAKIKFTLGDNGNS